MAWPKGKPRPPGAGRRTGTPNKLTTAAKEAFQIAFDKLKGVDGLVAWAKDNPTDFYKLYGKLIPIDIEGKMDMTAALYVGLAADMPNEDTA